MPSFGLWPFVASILCGTGLSIATLLSLIWVYRRGGVEDVREFAQALRELRLFGALEAIVSAWRQPPAGPPSPPDTRA